MNTSHSYDKESAPSQQSTALPNKPNKSSTKKPLSKQHRQVGQDTIMDNRQHGEEDQMSSSVEAHASLDHTTASTSTARKSHDGSNNSADKNHPRNIREEQMEDKTPMTIELTSFTPPWGEEDSCGEAACSGDEHTPPRKNLGDILPQLESASSISTTPTTLSSITDPSTMITPGSGQTLLSVEIQLQPDVDHIDVMFSETKRLLDYVQELDPTARFKSRGLGPDKKPLPDLTSSSCPHWPHNYASATGWYQTSTGYIFSLPPITAKQLHSRLESRRNRTMQDSQKKKDKKAGDKEERGPTAIYVTVNLYLAIPNIPSLLDSMNIDLRKSNIRVTAKALQCWESNSKKMICSIQNGLCVDGVKQLLLHRLKEMERKLCRHSKLNTLEWYDKPLPEINVTLRSIRELRLPDKFTDREELSFDPFPRTSKFAFFLEASDFAWVRIEPLLKMMVETNDIQHAFGPAAFLMDVPGPNPSMERTRAHQKHGRISMGYNIATTILECNEVQLFDYDVKVKMEPIEVLTAEGTPTGRFQTPRPPYARTNIRKELQRIRLNGEQIFHTAIMICKGPETGFSGIVVPYDPHDPQYREKYEFAKRTVASLACFMHHWLKQRGYCASTRSRLMRSFYVEKAQLASQSSWDPITMTATSHFAVKTDTYLLDNAKYDPFLRKQANRTNNQKMNYVDMSDTVRKGLLDSLGYNPEEKGGDVGSKVTGVSNLTGDEDTMGASTVNSEATPNRVMKTKEYAKQLADSREKNAQQAAEISELKQQMQRLTEMLAGISQQGAPHLSGSGAARPQDPGSGVAPQGS
jgi:hypothetical protein